ncbi:unnamed protein product [Amoebophrya sp. A120]|nr:unnamed protein product [Amoebophrya sp. A120]|eukprot:GSA120T00016632001.1
MSRAVGGLQLCRTRNVFYASQHRLHRHRWNKWNHGATSYASRWSSTERIHNHVSTYHYTICRRWCSGNSASAGKGEPAEHGEVVSDDFATRPRRSLHVVDPLSPELLKCLEFGSDCLVLSSRFSRGPDSQADFATARTRVALWVEDILKPLDAEFAAFERDVLRSSTKTQNGTSSTRRRLQFYRPEVLIDQALLVHRVAQQGVAHGQTKPEQTGPRLLPELFDGVVELLEERESTTGTDSSVDASVFVLTESGTSCEAADGSPLLRLQALKRGSQSREQRQSTSGSEEDFRNLVQSVCSLGIDSLDHTTSGGPTSKVLGICTRKSTDIPIVHEFFPLTKPEIAFHRRIVFAHETSLIPEDVRGSPAEARKASTSSTSSSAKFYKRAKKILKRASRQHIDTLSSSAARDRIEVATDKIESQTADGRDAIDEMVESMQGAVYMTPAQIARRKAFYKKHRDQPERYPTVTWISDEESEKHDKESEGIRLVLAQILT